jgi:stage V sporulation protein G
MAQITDVRIYKLKIIGPQKAWAAVTLDGEFAVHGLKVMENEGLWVSMPARKDTRGEYQDIFHPISREAREALTEAIIEAYKHHRTSEPREYSEDNKLDSPHKIILQDRARKEKPLEEGNGA